MTIRFVDPAGSNSTPYTAWSTAAPDLSTLLAGVTVAAGDEIRIIKTHSKDYGATVTLTFANGTAASPIRLVSVTKGVSQDDGSADTYAAGAIEGNTTTSYDLNLRGYICVFGVSFQCDDNLTLGFSGETQRFFDCAISSADFIYVGAESSIYLFDCDLSGTDATQAITIQTEGSMRMYGGSLTYASGTGAIFDLTGADSGQVFCWNVDMSGCASGMFLTKGLASTVGNAGVTLRQCKLPASSHTQAKVSDTPIVGDNWCRVEVCNTSTSTSRFLEVTRWSSGSGHVELDSTRNRTGGSSDGETSWSIQMQANSSCSYDTPLVGFPIAVNVTPTDTSKSVHIAGDTTDLTDKEFCVFLDTPSEASPAQPIHRYVYMDFATPYGLGFGSPCSHESNANTIARDSGEWIGSNTGVDASTGQQVIAITIAPIESGVMRVTPVLMKASRLEFVCGKLD